MSNSAINVLLSMFSVVLAALLATTAYDGWAGSFFDFVLAGLAILWINQAKHMYIKAFTEEP